MNKEEIKEDLHFGYVKYKRIAVFINGLIHQSQSFMKEGEQNERTD